MEWFIAAITVAALGVAAIAAAGGMGQMSRDPVHDTFRQPLPAGRLTALDVGQVRFGVTLRGYAMDQVDDLLARLAREIADRDAVIAELTVTGAPSDATADPAEVPVPQQAGLSHPADGADEYPPMGGHPR